MIKKIGCIEIPVSDMEKAVAFYEGVLGLKKTYEHPVWTSFDVGGVTFALAASGTKKSKKGAKVCTSCSLCVLRFAAGKMKQEKEAPTATSVIYFEVENLDEVYKKLKEQGVRFITEPKEQGWGGRTAVMLDPDNNILVLSGV
ncbi:MAG: VOC family protein [Thermoproteota archaeon]|nr:VOC family protein [Thermoproteota archaeon]